MTVIKLNSKHINIPPNIGNRVEEINKNFIKWFTGEDNIKNSHPLIIKWDVKREKQQENNKDKYIISITDRIPVCFCLNTTTSFQTSFTAPNETDSTMKWCSTISGFNNYETIFSIEIDKNKNEFYITDTTSFSLKFYLYPLFWYITNQLSSSHLELINHAVEDIKKNILEI